MQENIERGWGGGVAMTRESRILRHVGAKWDQVTHTTIATNDAVSTEVFISLCTG
jgi:hypothetical protein